MHMDRQQGGRKGSSLSGESSVRFIFFLEAPTTIAFIHTTYSLLTWIYLVTWLNLIV